MLAVSVVHVTDIDLNSKHPDSNTNSKTSIITLLGFVKIISSSFVYRMENSMMKYICMGLAII